MSQYTCAGGHMYIFGMAVDISVMTSWPVEAGV